MIKITTRKLMKKYELCPKCMEVPALTLRLVNSVPDQRVYELVCLNCGTVLETQVIDNTIIAVKELRDEMDKLYGKPTVYPTWTWRF